MNKLIFNYTKWIEVIEPELLNTKLNSILNASGYNILAQVDHHFKPQGYTGLWLLAESHLAIHTFPEKNKTYIELSGCNKKMNDIFISKLNLWIDELKAKS
ncbi:MAG: spermidine synthase [Bacteroidetes bacterium]|jgi:S-adenosylmethionine decarboxylase|nr:spermidine synthase [Bacteroidota bacterium]MBT6686312.1 spermidine synthase [Bacteroidota bacterium]MBT7142145.1 spermidine synthase [Bacteroidota bacterium]MBT7490500.1 spermidine synthase [Bacteroidota bacterium]